MPLLCRDPFFTKISNHRNVSLAVYLSIFYFSFCQKRNLHLYKRARLLSFLFTFSKQFIKMPRYQNILAHHVSIFETASNDMAQIDQTFFDFISVLNFVQQVFFLLSAEGSLVTIRAY